MFRTACNNVVSQQRRSGTTPWARRAAMIGAAASLAVLLGSAAASSPQEPKGKATKQEKAATKELKTQVAELVKQLDASKASARQSAQDELIKLGADVLRLLPAADDGELSAEQKRRLADVRKALGKQAGRAALAAATVTLKAKNITLSDALAEIRKQSGNEIVDVREDYNEVVTNPEFSADWDGKEFWQVMDDLSAKTRVGYFLHTGERHIGLRMQPVPVVPVAYAGPLRLGLIEIVRRIGFEDRQKRCTIQLEIAWEPRLKPMLFEVEPSELEVVDEQGNKLAIEAGERRPNAEEGEMVMKQPVDSTIIRTDFFIRTAQPPKGAEKVTIKGKMTVTMPADIQTFEFPDLVKAKNVKREKGNVVVTLEQFKELDEGVWGAELLLEFEAKGEAFESHETWYYDNEIYLQKADGTRFPLTGGTSQTQSADGRLGIQYRFTDAPGKISDYKLIYKTPSNIVREKLEFEFKDIELP